MTWRLTYGDGSQDIKRTPYLTEAEYVDMVYIYLNIAIKVENLTTLEIFEKIKEMET